MRAAIPVAATGARPAGEPERRTTATRDGRGGGQSHDHPSSPAHPAIFANRPAAAVHGEPRAGLRTLDRRSSCSPEPKGPRDDDAHHERRAARHRPVRRAARRARPEDDARRPSSSARSSTSGLAWVHFPEGHGGLGAVAEAAEHRQRQRLHGGGRAAAVRPQPDRLRHVRADDRRRTAATTQKQRYLRPLFTGEEIWCQMFSEPGAGSDVAGLVDARGTRRRRVDRSTARRCGRRSRTSSRFGIVLARTEPRRREAQGHDDVRRRHARARRRGAAARAGDRRGGVQRGLLHRRAHPRRRTPRRRRRRLGCFAHDADERARVDRRSGRARAAAASSRSR